MGVPTPRRYYLLKRLATAESDPGLSAAWHAKQISIPWPDLPAGFPSRAALMAAGYTTVRDLDGADERELTTLGLSRTEAQSVIGAMEDWTMIPAPLNGYTRVDGRFAALYDANLIPSAARTATFTGDTYEMGDMTTLRLLLDVTAASGTLPTLDVQVQTSPDGVNEWQAMGTFGQKTAVSTERFVFPGGDRYVRVVCTIGGTDPSFTFSVTGQAC